MAPLSSVLADLPLGYWPLQERPVSPVVLSDFGSVGQAMQCFGTERMTLGMSAARLDASSLGLVNPQYHYDGSPNYGGGFLRVDFGAARPAPAALTLELWYRLDAYNAGWGDFERQIIGSPDGEFHVNAIWNNSPSAGLRPLLKTTGGTDGWTSANDYRAAELSALGVWRHLALTWDGSALRLYLDGTLRKTGSVTGSMKPFRYLEVGRYGVSPTAPLADRSDTRYTQMGVSDVAIYERALGADRILAHYQEGRPLTPNPGTTALQAGHFTQAPRVGLGQVRPAPAPQDIFQPSARVLRPTTLTELVLARQYDLPSVQGGAQPVGTTLGPRVMLGRLAPTPLRRDPELLGHRVARVIPVTELTPAALANLRAGYQQGYADALRTTIRRHTPIFITNRRL